MLNNHKTNSVKTFLSLFASEVDMFDSENPEELAAMHISRLMVQDTEKWTILKPNNRLLL